MKKKLRRTANAIRIGILVVLLLIVGAAFAYDQLVAKPKFTKAWDSIKEIDAGGLSGRTRNVDVHKLIDKDPSHVDKSRSGFIVETYSWQRGLPFATFDIHVIYAENDTNDSLFYYSACANQDPSDENFPRKDMVVVNLNPPDIGRAGAGPAPDQASQPTRRDRDEDEEGDEDEEDKPKRPEAEGDEEAAAEKKDDEAAENSEGEKKEEGDDGGEAKEGDAQAEGQSEEGDASGEGEKKEGGDKEGGDKEGDGGSEEDDGSSDG